MTEKEIYKNGVALLEEWEDVNYCEHSFKFKDEWLTDKEVVDLLKQLNDETEELKKIISTLKDIIYRDEMIIIWEYSTKIGEEEELEAAYDSEDITELIKFCKRGK